MTKKIEDEIFYWREIIIHQHPDVFKVGTDALLLASWVTKIIESSDLILDVGTGTGVIALKLAIHFSEAHITAIDISQESIDVCNENISSSNIAGRVVARKEDIMGYTADKMLFDLVVCNPPFFFNQFEAQTQVLRRAKHAKDLIEDWVNALCNKMSAAGHLCVIVPSNLAYKWICAANEIGLYCQHRMDVFSFEKDSEPVRSLLHFRKGIVAPILTRMEIYTAKNKYAEGYINYTGIGSLLCINGKEKKRNKKR